MTITRTTTGSPGKASPARSRSIATKTTLTPQPAHRGAPRHYVETHVLAPRAYVEKVAKPAKAAPRHAAAPAKHAAAKAAHKPAHRAASETASRTTTDHEAIRRWAERRGGHPTSVTGTEHGKEAAGVLRLDFGVKDEKLHPVDWQAFFDKFEESKLAFLYQDKTSGGKMSRFHKFIHRH